MARGLGAGARATDWRRLGRRGAGLLGLLATWLWVVLWWTLRLAAHGAGRAGRSAWRLARLGARNPSHALGAVTAVCLALALVLVLRPAEAPHLDLARGLDCLALNIYHEARGEPLEGKIAVAQVVLNRVGDPDFPGDICGVVQDGGEWPPARCQFSWWCDGRSDRPLDLAAWKESQGLAQQVLDGTLGDPTRGALWYHAEHVRPEWRMDIAPRGKIGRHVFYVRRAP